MQWTVKYSAYIRVWFWALRDDAEKLLRLGLHWSHTLGLICYCTVVKRRAVSGRSQSREGEAASLNKGDTEWQTNDMEWQRPVSHPLLAFSGWEASIVILSLCVTFWVFLLLIIWLSCNMQFLKSFMSFLSLPFRKEKSQDTVRLLRDICRSLLGISKHTSCLDALK